jgi:hypothetical protein
MAAGSFKMLITFYLIAPPYIPEDRNLHFHRAMRTSYLML